MSLPRSAASARTLPVAGALALAAVLILTGAVSTAPAPLSAASLPYQVLLGAGLVSGLLSGMLGIGGALVTMPALYFALPRLGFTAAHLPQMAVAGALLAMVPTALAATWMQHRRGALDLGWVRRLGIPVAFGAAAGTLGATHLHGPVLPLMFAVQCFCYGACMIRSHRSPPAAGVIALRGPARLPPWAAGSLIGGFFACVGMGAGAASTPYLQSRGLDIRTAVPTAGAINLCIAFGGSLAFFAVAASRGGQAALVAWPAAILIGAVAVAVVPFGVAFAHRLSAPSFRLLVGAAYVAGALAVAVQTLA